MARWDLWVQLEMAMVRGRSCCRVMAFGEVSQAFDLSSDRPSGGLSGLQV